MNKPFKIFTGILLTTVVVTVVLLHWKLATQQELLKDQLGELVRETVQFELELNELQIKINSERTGTIKTLCQKSNYITENYYSFVPPSDSIGKLLVELGNHSNEDAFSVILNQLNQNKYEWEDSLFVRFQRFSNTIDSIYQELKNSEQWSYTAQSMLLRSNQFSLPEIVLKLTTTAEAVYSLLLLKKQLLLQSLLCLQNFKQALDYETKETTYPKLVFYAKEPIAKLGEDYTIEFGLMNVYSHLDYTIKMNEKDYPSYQGLVDYRFVPKELGKQEKDLVIVRK